LLQSHPEQLVFSLERTFRQHVYRAGDGCHREWLRRRALVSGPGQRLGQSLNLFHLVMLRLEQHLFQEPGLLRVIANSRQVQEEIGRHYHLKPERLRVIYNGLEHEHFHPCPEPARDSLRRELGAPPGARPVLFLGSGFERKGLSYILQAFAALKDGTAWLWVVGKGPPSFGRLAARLGLAGRVVFWGPQSEVSRFYQAAQVLVLPTIYDPCSNVVLEALACGCPVVTTAANGAAEFIAPGENGYVIANPADQAALTQALQQGLDLSQDPRARLAAQAGVAHLSWQTTVARTLEVLQEAAALVR
jgi:UDP-glucose:(heptosyl)LPS alpha-1,3-glucosyltransferase